MNKLWAIFWKYGIDTKQKKAIFTTVTGVGLRWKVVGVMVYRVAR